MISQYTPRWLRRLEKSLGWLAVPKVGILLVTLQAAGFFMVMSDPIWLERLALFPENVKSGEYWRLFTFLALPLSTSPLWVIFALWFIYYLLETLESVWGAFQTTFYLLFSIVVTILYSMATGHPVTSARHFESTLFLAAASLFPEKEQYFCFVPAKMKWLAWVSVFFVFLELFQGSWLDRGLVLAVYSSFLLFFGPAAWGSLKRRLRR
jgi:hypothetical protein